MRDAITHLHQVQKHIAFMLMELKLAEDSGADVCSTEAFEDFIRVLNDDIEQEAIAMAPKYKPGKDMWV
jgi:hypothetical protein|tara:strand:+ start:836 stop:1042 length:207 start_codon:yes stop_codon:yes gene_type:complete